MSTAVASAAPLYEPVPLLKSQVSSCRTRSHNKGDPKCKMNNHPGFGGQGQGSAVESGKWEVAYRRHLHANDALSSDSLLWEQQMNLFCANEISMQIAKLRTGNCSARSVRIMAHANASYSQFTAHTIGEYYDKSH